MTDTRRHIVYAAAYRNVVKALGALDSLERLPQKELGGPCDAAVIDKVEGKPHIVKRLDRPEFRVIPEAFGSGTLPRRELEAAAAELTELTAGLIAVCAPAAEKEVDNALFGADRVTKRFVDASGDEISDELREALKG